jgi:hypothetical protein
VNVQIVGGRPGVYAVTVAGQSQDDLIGGALSMSDLVERLRECVKELRLEPHKHIEEFERIEELLNDAADRIDYLESSGGKK